ncbi:MAG TPA: hypothetical protein VFE72_07460 [Lysobacter sp.]|nr:hypothetical protein [Lysobacter sp.]
MKNLLFDFNKLGPADSGVKKAVQQFGRAGSRVAQTEAVAGIKRTSGISYRELSLTFADSQRVVLRIKQSGDIWQVLLNGTVVPVRNQDDHVAAVAEIAKAMDAGRQKFQRRLAAIKVKPPAGIRTAAPKMEQVLTQRRDTLKEAIAEVREEIVRVRASNAAPAAPAAAAPAARAAWELPMDAWVEQQLNTGRYADHYASNLTARAVRAKALEGDYYNALFERAKVARIANDVLDDYVNRHGDTQLRARFRGAYEKGIEGYRVREFRGLQE